MVNITEMDGQYCRNIHVFEYELWVNNTGTFSSGITSVQCLYAPEFVSHTGGEKITVK